MGCASRVSEPKGHLHAKNLAAEMAWQPGAILIPARATRASCQRRLDAFHMELRTQHPWPQSWPPGCGPLAVSSSPGLWPPTAPARYW